VTRQEPVDVLRRDVPRAPGVDHQHAPPAPPQDEGGAQPGGTRADDDGVVHPPCYGDGIRAPTSAPDRFIPEGRVVRRRMVCVANGRYWTRTSDLFLVMEA